MFKLLIVDDEKWIREGLSEIINWSEHQISEVRTAVDGQDAVALMKTFTPDLVISDIVMPRMSGIALITWLHENLPEVKTIMLSGFDEFGYARDALRMGASDYLLKPINENLLIEAVEKAQSQISAKRVDRIQIQHYTESGQNLKQLFYLHLLDTQMNTTALHQFYCEFLQIPLEVTGCYCNAIWNTEQLDSGLQRNLATMIENKLRSITNANRRFDVIPFDSYIAVLAYDKTPTAPLDRLLATVFAQLKDFSLLSTAYSCCVGHAEVGAQGLQASVQGLNLVLQNSFLLTEQVVHMVDEVRTAQTSDLYRCTDLIQRFMDELRANGVELGVQTATQFVQDILTAAPSIGKAELGTILFQIMLDCIRMEESAGSLSKEAIAQDNAILTRMFDLRSIEEAKTEFKNFFSFLTDAITVQTEDAKKLLARKALQYIHKNYAHDISVQEIASSIHISNSYFSQLFSKEVGRSFSKYLMEYRIERAKELLLNTPQKIYAVAAAVGYADVKYFLKVFKNSTGVSPQVFRDKGTLSS